MNEQLIIEKTKHLLEVGCCPELAAAAQEYLAAQGTERFGEATEKYIKELKDGIVTIDELLELFQMPQFIAQVGQDQSKMLFEQFTAQKAAGETRCHCEACNTASDILELFKA